MCIFCSTACCVNAIKAKCKMCKSKYLNVLFWAWSDALYAVTAATATLTHAFSTLCSVQFSMCVWIWTAYRLNFPLTYRLLIGRSTYTLFFRARHTNFKMNWWHRTEYSENKNEKRKRAMGKKREREREMAWMKGYFHMQIRKIIFYYTLCEQQKKVRKNKWSDIASTCDRYDFYCY